jgi:hypothetical protein
LKADTGSAKGNAEIIGSFTGIKGIKGIKSKSLLWVLKP